MQRFHHVGRSGPWLEPRHHHLPPGTHTFGMVLFLISLTVLFAASLVAFLLSRFRPDQPMPTGGLEVPGVLWASTLVLLASSFTVHAAVHNVRHERQTRFRHALTVTLLLALAFLLLQAPGLSELLWAHRQFDDMHLYGWMFFLVLLHAAHLVGGVIPLAVVHWRAHQGRYDHEHHNPVRHLAMYWHFLDGVWIALFAVLLVAR